MRSPHVAMRQFARMFATPACVTACGMVGLGEPGTPDGGPYCNRGADGAPACYPTEAERATAWSGAGTTVTVAPQPTGESPQQRSWREDEERKAAETKARDEAFAERERKRLQEAEAKAARAAEVKAAAADKAHAVPAISAIMCSIDAELAELRADMAREKRVTGTSGVVNLRARDEIARDIVADTDELAGWRAALKRFGASQLPCKDVAGIVACRQRIETCDEASRLPAEVWAKEQATLWGSDKERPQR